MSSRPIKLTISDPDSGEVLAEEVVENDYVVICAGNRYVSGSQFHASTGTHVVTIKRGAPTEDQP